MPLTHRIKYSYALSISHIQHIIYHQRYALCTSLECPNTKKEYEGKRIHKLKWQSKFKLKQIQELEDKQKRGHVLNENQLKKIKQKQTLQHKVQDITNGTFAYEYRAHESDTNITNIQRNAKASHSKTAQQRQRQRQNICYDFEKNGRCKFGENCRFSHEIAPNVKPHSLSIAPLKRHHIKGIMNDNSSRLDLNEKFEKLLSRPTYSIWAVRELFAGFNDTEWKEIPTEYIRHILDAYYVRNDIVFVYKILMKWFKHKMGNRYVLYSDLCKAMTDIDNMKHAIEVFEYLLYSLMRAHTKNEDIALLLYIIYDLMNVLIPRMMSLGQFHVFDELLSKLMELKENGVIASDAMNGVFSVSNLALLWRSCVENESLHRLLVVIKWMNECKDSLDINGLLNKLEHGCIETALVLAMHSNNNALFVEIMNLCQDRMDVITFDGKDSVVYCIQNGSLHCVLNEDNYWCLSNVMDLNGVLLDDIVYFEQIVERYCKGNNNKLSVKSWHIICDWLLHFMNTPPTYDACQAEYVASIINDMMYYFAVRQCFESLLMDNSGDAVRWTQLIYKLLVHKDILACIEHQHNNMNAIVCGAQIIAYLRNFKQLSNVINHLPHDLMMIHCVDIIDCCVCGGIDSLQINENGIFERMSISHDQQQEGIEIMKRAFEIIEILDEIHAAGNIINNGWIQGEKKFRTTLEDSLQNIDHNMDHNAINGAFAKYHQQHDTNCKDGKYDLKWFDALSAFAFDQK